MEKVTLPVRLFSLLGVELLVGKRPSSSVCLLMRTNRCAKLQTLAED